MISSLLALMLLAAPLAVQAGTITPITPPGQYDHCPQDARQTFGATTFNGGNDPGSTAFTPAGPYSVGIPFSKVNHDDGNVAVFYLGITDGNANDQIILTQITPNSKTDAEEGAIVGNSFTVTLPETYSSGDVNTHFQQISLNQGSLIINSGDYIMATIPSGSSVKFASTCALDWTNNADNDRSSASYVYLPSTLPAKGGLVTYTKIGNSGGSPNTVQSPNGGNCQNSRNKVVYPAPVFGFYLIDCPYTFSWFPSCPTEPPLPICPTTEVQTYHCEDSTGNTVGIEKCGTLPVDSGKTCPCKESGGQVIGDPIFSGFHGQQYQVHGLPGSVFNIFTHQYLQVNARFELITEGRTQDIIDGIKASNVGSLPDTAVWTHPGTYLGEISVQTSFARVNCKSGKYEFGITECTAENINGEKLNLSIGDIFYLSNDSKQFIKRNSSHIIAVTTDVLNLELVNSDNFFNIQSATLSRTVASSQISGLLGASASPSFKQLNGQQVFEFLVTPASADDLNDLTHNHSISDMFGIQFKLNKFGIQA